jgi:hypothetical protein
MKTGASKVAAQAGFSYLYMVERNLGPADHNLLVLWKPVKHV